MLCHILAGGCCHELKSDPCRESECVAKGEDQKGSRIRLYQDDCASFKVRSIEFAGVDCVLLVEEVWTSCSCGGKFMLAIEWKSFTSVNWSVSLWTVGTHYVLLQTREVGSGSYCKPQCCLWRWSLYKSALYHGCNWFKEQHQGAMNMWLQFVKLWYQVDADDWTDRKQNWHVKWNQFKAFWMNICHCREWEYTCVHACVCKGVLMYVYVHTFEWSM